MQTHYHTTRQTTVEVIREPSPKRRASKRPIPFGEPLRVSPKKQAALVMQREDDPHQVVAIPVKHTEYWEFGQDSGLVLVVARLTPRMADILKMCFEAFPDAS